MSRAASYFGVNTYSYTLSHGVRDCLPALVERGYVEFELMMYPGHLWPAEVDGAARRELRRLVDSLGAKVTTLNMPNIDVNIAGATAEMRAYSLAHLRNVVDLAGDLGVPGVVIGPGKANPLFPAPAGQLAGYFHAALDDLVPRAAAAGTALQVENMPFAFLPDIGSLLATLDRYGDDRIGIVYDVANGHFIDEDVPGALRQCSQRLAVVHLSDTTRAVYRHDPVGRGDVDFAPIPAVLDEIGYARRPVLEVISRDADREIDASAARLAALGFEREAE
jgi:sugar phosphate isomerase/epimerase